MVTIDLTFLSRVKLIGILSGARGGEGGYEKLHALLKVFEAVRFTEADMASIVVTDLGNGTANYRIDAKLDAGGFAKQCTLEDQQIKWLGLTLDAWIPQATIDDLSWLEPLQEQLKERKAIKGER